MKTELKHLFRPNQDGKTQPPLLLLLHGYGSNEQDLFSFAEELPKEFFIISVRAPISLAFGGYAWYDINFTDAQKFNNKEQAHSSIQLIRQFIAQAIEKYKLQPNEVWLCGFSQGAILSNALALQHPDEVKKVIMLSGYTALDIVGELPPKEYKDLAYFVSHGTEDAVIPIDWANKTPAFLEEKGIECLYREYKSGHGLVPQNFYDMLAWIKDHQYSGE